MPTLSRDNINEHCAIQCEGYVRAGVAPNGVVLLHPPGERNRSVPVPAYTDSWDACMRLVWRYELTVEASMFAGKKIWVSGENGDWCEWPYCHTDGEARRAIVSYALRMAQEVPPITATTESEQCLGMAMVAIKVPISLSSMDPPETTP